MHYELAQLKEHGYAVLKDYDGPPIPEKEFRSLEFIDWKSGGDTNFAPIASALGEMECGGFWSHGKPDKDGIWTDNRKICPSLVQYVENIGARFGRVRVIELKPYESRDHVYKQMHLDDNNRLNPEGEGWVVRSWLELTDSNATFILREDKDDELTESRIPLHAGMQFVIDTQRLWHVVHNPGPQPRYAVITSWESGDALQAWIDAQLPVGEGAGAR